MWPCRASSLVSLEPIDITFAAFSFPIDRQPRAAARVKHFALATTSVRSASGTSIACVDVVQPRAFLPRTVPASAQPPDRAFEADCFDFTAYLARRLGVGQALAHEVLGAWLENFDGDEQSTELGGAFGTGHSEVPSVAGRSSAFHFLSGTAPRARERTGTDD